MASADYVLLGEIVMLPFDFVPKGFAWCNGQLLPVAQNVALFSVLGTTYGGDGSSTFALPNLQGRVPLHKGQGPGLPSYSVGEIGGVENVTLTVNEIPNHTHPAPLKIPAGGAPDKDSPINGYPATFPVGTEITGIEPLLYADNALAQMGSIEIDAETGVSGEGLPHNNMQPFLTCHYAIALQGIFPNR